MKKFIRTVASKHGLQSFCSLRLWSSQRPRCSHVRFIHRVSNNPEKAAKYLRRVETPSQFTPLDTNSFGSEFRDIGVKETIVSAVRRAFPNVQQPTLAQAEFIPCILTGKDVLLHDTTGTGKSFGIMLALISKDRSKIVSHEQEKKSAKHAITSLVIVPHRDLAYQMLYWTEAIYEFMKSSEKMEMKDFVQAAVRGSSTPTESQIQSLRSNPPHIFIATPQALLDIYNADRDALQIETLSTIAVDEVDYLIDIPSTNLRKAHVDSAWKNFKRHPSPTRFLLGEILKQRNPGALSGVQKTVRELDNRTNDNSVSTRAPPIQVVMSSATVHSNLREYVTGDTRWLGGTREDFILVRRPKRRDMEMVRERWDAQGSTVTYHALVVSADGRISNIEGAVAHVDEAQDKTSLPEERDPQSRPLQNHDKHIIPSATTTTASRSSKASKVNRKPQDIQVATPHFSPRMIEAVATCFALQVPHVALLVLPPSASVQPAVDDLRDLGVNAESFDLMSSSSPGRAHLLHGLGNEGVETPTLLVTTPASTRGIDLPELSHVFILGIPDVANADVFRHISGRVDRFGRGGKVISFLKDREEEFRDGMVKTKTNEPHLIRLIYRRLGIKPTLFDLDIFD